MEVIQRNEQENIWIVRSQGGIYLNHFKQYGIASIGHLDDVDIVTPQRNSSIKINLEALQKQLLASGDTSKAVASSTTSQVKRFISEMQINDLIVTVDSSRALIGRVSGHAYLDKEPCEIKYSKDRSASLKHILRRPVIWGRTVSREILPLPLEKSLFSHRTIINISDNWEYIYHLLYPAFTDNNQLYMSLFINREDSISATDISRLLLLLDGIETFASTFTNDEAFELGLKASFFSKGPLFPSFSFNKPVKASVIAIGISLAMAIVISGIEVKDLDVSNIAGIELKIGSIQLKGILDSDFARELIKNPEFVAPIIELMKKHSTQSTTKNLDLDLRQKDNKEMDKFDGQPVNEVSIQIA